MTLILAVLLAQEVSFAPLPREFDLGPFQRYTVSVYNPQAAPVTVTGALVMAKAMGAGISPATATALQAAAQSARSPGWYRRTMIGLELAGVGATALMAGDAVRIRERTKALIPIGTAVLAGIRLAAERERPEARLPDDLVPGVFLAPAGGVAIYSLFGTPKGAR